MENGDMPTRPIRKRMAVPTPIDAPRCRCHAKAQLYKEGKDFIVACSDPYCPLEDKPLAESEACPTVSGAWQFWQWRRTGRIA